VRARLALACGLKLGQEELSLEAVCQRLADDAVQPAMRGAAVTPRQLQKRLSDHGLTFKALVEEVRRERALRLLRETDHSMQAIAHDCGYTELSPFHRAVRRWTGLTPAQVRQQALDALPAEPT
jgi:transcriptional regulator GlxA family with amidase domain